MRRTIPALVLTLLICLPGLAFAQVASDGAPSAIPEIVRDYAIVRNVGLSLAAIAFLIALTKVGSSEQPYEQTKAQSMLIRAALIFVVLAGDRMIARGLVDWFGLSSAALPVFWQ